jgi:hypothetical protein
MKNTYQVFVTIEFEGDYENNPSDHSHADVDYYLKRHVSKLCDLNEWTLKNWEAK